MLTTAPRGTRDILPEEAVRWQYVEQVIRECCICMVTGNTPTAV